MGHKLCGWVWVFITLLMPATALAKESPVVAVSYFANHSTDPAFRVLSRGLAEMLTTDLNSAGLKIVERNQLDQVLKEHELSASSFIDPDTAVVLGKGLSASHMVVGGYTVIGETMRLDARVIAIDTGEVILSESEEATKDKWSPLARQLADGIATQLQAKTPTSAASTADFQALLDYSSAIHMADKGHVKTAKHALEALLKRSPDFAAAEVQLARLKVRAAKFAQEYNHTLSGAFVSAHAVIDSLPKTKRATPDEYKRLLTALKPIHQVNWPMRVREMLVMRDLYELSTKLITRPLPSDIHVKQAGVGQPEETLEEWAYGIACFSANSGGSKDASLSFYMDLIEKYPGTAMVWWSGWGAAHAIEQTLERREATKSTQAARVAKAKEKAELTLSEALGKGMAPKIAQAEYLEDLAYGYRSAGAKQLTAETWLKLAVDHPDWRTGPRGKKTHDPMISACAASVNVDFKLYMVACTSPRCTDHPYCLKSSK